MDRPCVKPYSELLLETPPRGAGRSPSAGFDILDLQDSHTLLVPGHLDS